MTWRDKCGGRDEIGMQICLLESTDGIIDEPTWFSNFKALPARQPRKGRKISLSRGHLKTVGSMRVRLGVFPRRRSSPGNIQSVLCRVVHL